MTKKKLNTYSVYGTVTGSKYLGDFQATTPEEAIDMAIDSDAGHVSLCHQCSGQCEDPEIHNATAELVEE